MLRVFAEKLATLAHVDLVETKESKVLVAKLASKVLVVSLVSLARLECRALQACVVLVVSLVRGV